MARQRTLALLAGIGILAASCGRGSGSSGPPTAPSAPSAQAPAVNVSGHWTGQESHAQSSGTLTLDLMQTGAQVSGTLSGFGKAGPFVGTVSGNTLSFNFSYGNGGNGCGNAISGTATIGLVSLIGTFNGQDCAGQAVTNGTMMLSLGAGRTSAPPIGGTWEGSATLQSSLGGGTWTWVLSPSSGEASGGNFTGSVTVFNNSQGITTGTVSGTVSNTFPGPLTLVNLTANLLGRCPVTLMVTNANMVQQPNALIALSVGTLTGTTCNGPFAPAGFALVRVSDSTSPPSPTALDLSGNWSGPSSDSFESGTLSVQLTQTGTFVSGTLMLALSDVTRGGNLQASLFGSTVTFTINIGPQGNCPTTVTGTAQATSSSIDGTYSGASCQGSVTNGHLTLSRQ